MTHKLIILFLLALVFNVSACSKKCTEEEAMNRMLALNKLVARLIATGGDGLTNFALALQTESGAVSELVAKQDYTGACVKTAELAEKYKLDLDKEMEGMITYEQLVKDGGKGSGTCSIADAAKKQMEVHGLLQKAVEEKRLGPDIFQTFNNDTQGYAEMLSTNPSKACELLDKLKTKYGV